MISAMELFVQIIAIVVVTAVAWIGLDLIAVAKARPDRHRDRSSTPDVAGLGQHREEVHS